MMRQSFVLAACAVLLAACSQNTDPDSSDESTSATPSASPSAAATPSPSPSTAGDGSIKPSPDEAASDQVTYDDRECHQDKRSTKVLTCVFGDPQGDVEIVAVGDSKTEQYLPVLDAVGKERGWRVVGMTKSACAFSTAQLAGGANPNPSWQACEGWNRNALAKIQRMQPDAVFTALYKLKVPQFGRDIDGDEQKALMADGIHDALERSGAASIVLRSTPRAESDTNIPTCVAEHERDTSRCDITGDTITDPSLVWTRAEEDDIVGGLDDATVMTINDQLCSSKDRCEAVADGILRYRDSHHLTRTFILSIADVFGERLAEALDAVGVQP
ncbi:SGNH hydrolase domain-containing protein [Aeromicrobium sp. IC_218]|uniref:SGNH hydrolase domain-containing protein n=1 Tax=Aeromicrobium sp. IC_218 TaxID=2545468 RepID=UPI00103F042D|nr:SGNH hydrolase domain-containing protein [Aeromicrobium sp. IC_218]TCI97378.1 hypothetical protein E0W78_12450 [Aeromicrobium sp. IC_218]